ncbi:hypothetical protein [Bradymonas sediminis]|uniref:hypothetical protein n=1 Tax=Bradymonas sediminis TaxID=1548548 RepID=UPI00105D0C1F|nr:hypothetical protein [Bradymonas sediminis]
MPDDDFGRFGGFGLVDRPGGSLPDDDFGRFGGFGLADRPGGSLPDDGFGRFGGFGLVDRPGGSLPDDGFGRFGGFGLVDRPGGSLPDDDFGRFGGFGLAASFGLREDSPPATKPDSASLRPWVRRREHNARRRPPTHPDRGRLARSTAQSNAIPPCVTWAS